MEASEPFAGAAWDMLEGAEARPQAGHSAAELCSMARYDRLPMAAKDTISKLSSRWAFKKATCASKA